METFIVEETPILASMNGHKQVPVTRLCAIDRVFDATGEVTVRCGPREVVLPIQAVDQELVDALVRDKEPKPKTINTLENGRRVVVIDQTHEPYRRAMDEFQRLRSYVFVLCGIACDVCDRSGTPVWTADNGKRDLDAARQALKDMGMVDNQLLTIIRAINNLTTAVEEQQISD